MELKRVTQRLAGVVEVFDDAIANCNEIVDYLERRGEWIDARVGREDGAIEPDRRSNQVTFFNPFDLRCHELLYGLAKAVWHYINDYAIRYDVAFSAMEPVNVNRYSEGQFYLPHSDDGPGHNRVISALVYLNDVTEGGETEFIFHDVSIKPQVGRLIIFPSTYAYTHAAHPPKRGVKYSAAFWTVRPL